MKKPTILGKLTRRYGAVVAIALVLGFFPYTQLLSDEEDVDSITVSYVPRKALSGNASVFFRASYDATLKHANTNRAVEKAALASDVASNIANVTKLLKDYEGTVVSDRDRQLFGALQSSHGAFVTALNEAIRLSDLNHQHESLGFIRVRLDPSYAAVVKATDDLEGMENVGSSVRSRLMAAVGPDE